MGQKPLNDRLGFQSLRQFRTSHPGKVHGCILDPFIPARKPRFSRQDKWVKNAPVHPGKKKPFRQENSHPSEKTKHSGKKTASGMLTFRTLHSEVPLVVFPSTGLLAVAVTSQESLFCSASVTFTILEAFFTLNRSPK